MNKGDENKIKIKKEDYVVLQKTLSKYPYKFYAYRSRVGGYTSKYSDIDIFCKDRIKITDLIDIKLELEKSKTTIKIDLIDASYWGKGFLDNIEENLIELWQYIIVA